MADVMSVGDKISYPSQGPCVVGPMVQRNVGGKLTDFYHLVLLDRGGGDLFIPLDADTRGIRKLLKKSEIPGLLERIDHAAASTMGWNDRTRKNLTLFASGAALDLAEIIGSMTQFGDGGKFQPSDRKTLARAKKILICEIAEVTGQTKDEVQETIDNIIERRSAN